MSVNHTNDHRQLKGIIAGFLFLFTLTLFLPGAYSVDSWNQWREVTSKQFDDWYGTGMVTTWRFLWILTGNYMCLYVMQMFLYWTFITLILWPVPFKSVVYWLTLGAALFFCFIPQYVMRDSLTVLVWGVTAMLLLYAANDDVHRRKLVILALLLLAYGVWVRINAIVALLPLAYASILLLDGGKLALWKRLLLTVAGSIVLVAGIQLFTYRVQKAQHLYPEYKLKLLDLTGISRLSGENCFPEAVTSFPASALIPYTPATPLPVSMTSTGPPTATRFFPIRPTRSTRPFPKAGPRPSDAIPYIISGTGSPASCITCASQRDFLRQNTGTWRPSSSSPTTPFS